jgi:hypothetical protein
LAALLCKTEDLSVAADGSVMDNEEKPVPFWLRLCGAVLGGILCTIGGVVLLFVGVVMGANGDGNNPAVLIGSLGVVGTCVGFALPRQMMNSLVVFLPDTGE